MLRELSIRDILLISSLDLSFSSGLNVLTGETGAGKSILLDCLGFVLGWRGRADIVRSGASEGEVSADFDLAQDHPARTVLEEAGLPIDDTLIVRRINTADGRKRAFVNDRRASGEVLRALSDSLVELHGQHDDRGLLDPRGHRALLDAFGKLDAQRDGVRAAWRARAAAARDLATAQDAFEEARSDEDYLRHALKELAALGPEAGEDEALDTRRRLMQAATRIKEDVAKAAMAMGSDGADGQLTDALRWLEDVADAAGGALEEPIAALGRTLSELGDAMRGIEDALQQMDVDPLTLETVEERLFAIRALARKHNVAPDALAALHEDFQARLAQIDGGESDLKALQTALDDADAAYVQAAEALSAKRISSGKKLNKAMMDELAPLKLERAVFDTQITSDDPGPDGVDRVTFTVATNPGTPAGPINKIASGGELSRFLLALKVCLTQRAEGLTMIFDEIDRGVGGATADAVGRRLARVAHTAQVLVVTHSPQVAALGAHHWQVAKSVTGETTLTDVRHLDADARVDEIARMLAGDTVTDEARSAARSLLSASSN